jgi:ferric-dicitrate binding protein FerR (iron transport regulator)
MSEKPSPEEAALWRRRLASQANNRAWTLAESLSRTPDEDEEMLQAAHAAMYFWKIVGNSRNQAHAAQLVAHVYALLGQAEPAKYFQAKVATDVARRGGAGLGAGDGACRGRQRCRRKQRCQGTQRALSGGCALDGISG